MFDCHIHSEFSGDSRMPAVTACDTAIDNGLDGIAFTDHLDVDFPDFDEGFNIDFNRYSDYMDNLKLQYMGRLKVLKGIEVGIQPHVLDETLKVVTAYDFDMVIGSVHIIDGTDPYVGRYYTGKTKQQAYFRYLEEILFAVRNYKDYDVVGHIGYIRRYGDYDDRTLRYSDNSEILDEILKTVISDGKGIEINSSGYRNGLGSPMPDYDIVKRFRQLGGEIISIGSDAHYQQHIGHSFDVVRNELLNMGISYTAHFEQRKPVFTALL